MIKNLDRQKENLKEKINKEIDDYFETLESSAEQEGFDINRLEQLMLRNHGEVKTILNEAHSELASNVEVNVKKNAQSAEKP